MTPKDTGKEVGTDALANNPPVVSKHSTTKGTSPDLREQIDQIFQDYTVALTSHTDGDDTITDFDTVVLDTVKAKTALNALLASQRGAVLTELEGRLPSKKYPCFQRAVAPTYSAPVVLESVLSSMDSHHEASRNTGYNAYRKAVTAVIKDMKEQKS